MWLKEPFHWQLGWLLPLDCFRLHRVNMRGIKKSSYICCASYHSKLSLCQQKDFLDAVWSSHVQPGDSCIDATCGKGRDSLRIAKLVGPKGFLLACDIQTYAIYQTEALLRSEIDPSQYPRVEFVCNSHEFLSKYVKDNSIRLISYNLGYLPNGDRQIRTTARTTTNSLESLLPKLCHSGIISLVCYVGHPGGLEERSEVLNYVAKLPKDTWSVTYHEWINRSLAPSIVIVEKK
ncbi:Putative rRNA methylase YtqB [Galdieria sulphuraria]|nr:Putative rRNA methylase YtqB [Galdieria sulphuraria]